MMSYDNENIFSKILKGEIPCDKVYEDENVLYRSNVNITTNYLEEHKNKMQKSNILEGKSIFNVFFEDSTRTRTSFEIAAKRLGADLINVS